MTFLIREAGIKLDLREEAVATACVFYHKFTSSMAASDYDQNLLLMACLSLAAKVQEHSVKLGDVVNTCHRCLHKDKPPLEVGETYWKLKESVGKYELLLLRAIQFNLKVKLPHPYLLHYLLALSRWVSKEEWHKSHVTRLSWALLQDSFHTTLSLRHPPHMVATAALYLAMQCCKLVVPGSEEAQWAWWEVFSEGSKENQLQEIAGEIMDCISHNNHNQTDS